jgi:nicotinate-nucleotide adenylyltransferase
MARIGIFSGTFDPVHVGHIAFCKAAAQAAGLSKVILLPEARPRYKQPHTPYTHRVAMLKLAIQHEPGLEVLQLADEQFTVTHTLPQLQQQFPEDELYLLLGSDVAHGITKGWPGLETLLGRMQLIVGVRGQQTPHSVQGLLQTLRQMYPQTNVRATIVQSPHAYAASSRVRAALPAAQQTSVIPTVAEYISAYNLYAGAAA